MNAPSDWYARFFSGLAVDFWQAVVSDETTQTEAAFLEKHLRISPGSRVLDAPCGAGRLSLALAARGAIVTGVDLSTDFLAAARRSAGQRKIDVSWRQSDMRDLPWSGDFDAAFCFGNSFGYLDDAGNQAFLESVFRALVAGGRFAIDYGQSAESVLPRWEPRLKVEMSGFDFLEENRYDWLSGRVENRYVISRGGKSEEKLASQRAYTVREVVEALAAAGFLVRDLFGSIREDPFALGAQNLLIVAEKPVAGGSAPGTPG
ncbi:MAG: methyltransferase domain-containing protein [Acidobacteriota bacterium]